MCHDEAVTHVDAWLDSRLERSHRALGLREPLGKLDLELGARSIRQGATRATTSQGISRRTSRFESCRTIASSTVRSSADAVDLAAATARRPSDACIFAFPYDGGSWQGGPPAGTGS